MSTEPVGLSESIVEQTTLIWFEELGYTIYNGTHFSPGEEEGEWGEREDFSETILSRRLRAALREINPHLPPEALDEAYRVITRFHSANLVENNRCFHRLLTEGVDVAYRDNEGEVNDKAWLLDLENLENNDWLAVNQLTVVSERRTRRADIVVFVNGLPLAVLELKNPGSENATLANAYQQLQNYKKDIPALFAYNEIMIISDGIQARAGTLTSGWDRFVTWRTVDGGDILPKGAVELETMINGMFHKHRFLDLVLNFTVFEDTGGEVFKKAAAYHQFHAVNKAVACTFSACGKPYDERELIGRYPAFREEEKPRQPDRIQSSPPVYGEGTAHFRGRRIGVIWHTQGSGKSLSMAFLAGKLARHPGMKNPTIVVITDRNDLDGQLYTTFAGCKDLLRQEPRQCKDRAELRRLLHTGSGGVIFTTIQKFMPENKGDSYPCLSERENIVVIADEAHRSQYDFIDGYARHLRDALPNASFIGFTGTPVESSDRSTPAVFGDYIDTYDILQAVEDRATVPIYYEGRLAQIHLEESEKPWIDSKFEYITEGEEETEKQRLRSRWARLEAMVGAEKRLRLVVEDMLSHLDRRLEAMEGKFMMVCMSRRICIDVYNLIVKLRPDWHHPDDKEGKVKIIMTGSTADDGAWYVHTRGKSGRDAIARRFKDPEDPLKLVIVRDMWLTGFDCPPLHTMYIDKPMQGHGLMQAIARVNRVFRDKPGGLVVDYIGLADQLQDALSQYTQAGGRGEGTFNQETAVAVMIEKYEIVTAMFYGFDYQPYIRARGMERMRGIAAAANVISSLEDGNKRYLRAVTELSQAFALSVPHPETMRIRDELGFFQEIRAQIAKYTVEGARLSPEEMDSAVRQLVSRAIGTGEVMDIFAAVGLRRPDISILSEEFLEEVRRIPYRNLAVELLRKLLNDEIHLRFRRNIVQARSFAEMLEEAVRRYINRTVEAAQVIEELIHLAHEIANAQKRGEATGLTEDEIAFYDALEVNDSAVRVLGDETLKIIARELVKAVRGSLSIDWTVRENVRAKIRVIVKRILRKYGYPPDKQEKATETVLKQAEVICREEF